MRGKLVLESTKESLGDDDPKLVCKNTIWMHQKCSAAGNVLIFCWKAESNKAVVFSFASKVKGKKKT